MLECQTGPLTYFLCLNFTVKAILSFVTSLSLSLFGGLEGSEAENQLFWRLVVIFTHRRIFVTPPPPIPHARTQMENMFVCVCALSHTFLCVSADRLPEEGQS